MKAEVIELNSNLSNFVEMCEKKAELENSGNWETGNQLYNRIIAIYNELETSGREKDLLELLDYKNPWVRLWAATFMLKVDSKKAEQVLEELSTLKFVGFDAKITLQEWRKGNLKL